jgi:hypothetical protein
MSLGDVRADWDVYRKILRVMRANFEGRIVLDGPGSPVGPFPAAPADWSRWATAAMDSVDIAQQAHDMDQARRDFVAAIVDSELEPTAVVVPPPTAVDVQTAVDQLRALNERIRADARFHAALGIGVALAGEIETRFAG